jgi:hypothetical protein
MLRNSDLINKLNRGDNINDIAKNVLEEVKKEPGASLKLDSYVKYIKRLYKTYKNYMKSISRPEVKKEAE